MQYFRKITCIRKINLPSNVQHPPGSFICGGNMGDFDLDNVETEMYCSECGTSWKVHQNIDGNILMEKINTSKRKYDLDRTIMETNVVSINKKR
jgi:hypothetical protein